VRLNVCSPFLMVISQNGLLNPSRWVAASPAHLITVTRSIPNSAFYTQPVFAHSSWTQSKDLCDLPIDALRDLPFTGILAGIAIIGTASGNSELSQPPSAASPRSFYLQPKREKKAADR
jgi:hypothetical protein